MRRIAKKSNWRRNAKRLSAAMLSCVMGIGLVQVPAMEKRIDSVASDVVINTYAAGDGTDDDWLHVEGSDIVDKDGNVVRLVGANWFGLNCCERILHGLGWGVNMSKVLKECADRGINLLRIPVSTQILLEWKNGEAKTPDTPVDADGFNKELVHADGTPYNNLEIFNALISMCKENGIKIMVDVHSAEANNSGHNYPLWYNTGSNITTEDWIEGWTWLAETYKNDDTIIACDLKNEPHGKVDEGDFAKWDDSEDLNNWKYAAERCAKEILKINPNLLIMVEGIEMNPKDGLTYDANTGRDWAADGQPYINYEGAWWGGNLRMAKQYPVDFGSDDWNDQLVYSPHDYGPLVWEQTWFNKDFTEETLLEDYWYDAWAYLVEENISPLLIGEWGGFMDGGDNEKWMNLIAEYMNKKNISHTFWCLNPNSGDTGGLLNDDWKTWDEEKYALFEKTLWKDSYGRYVGLDHQKGLGENGITIGEFYNPSSTPVITTTSQTASTTTQAVVTTEQSGNATSQTQVTTEQSGNATSQTQVTTEQSGNATSQTQVTTEQSGDDNSQTQVTTEQSGNDNSQTQVTTEQSGYDNPQMQITTEQNGNDNPQTQVTTEQSGSDNPQPQVTTEQYAPNNTETPSVTSEYPGNNTTQTPATTEQYGPNNTETPSVTSEYPGNNTTQTPATTEQYGPNNTETPSVTSEYPGNNTTQTPATTQQYGPNNTETPSVTSEYPGSNTTQTPATTQQYGPNNTETPSVTSEYPGSNTTQTPATTQQYGPNNTETPSVTSEYPGSNTTQTPSTTEQYGPNNTETPSVTSEYPGSNTTQTPATTEQYAPNNTETPSVTSEYPGSNTTQTPATTEQYGPNNTETPSVTSEYPGNNTTQTPVTTEQTGNNTTQSPVSTTQTPATTQNVNNQQNAVNVNTGDNSVSSLFNVNKVTSLRKVYAKATSVKLKWKKQTGVSGYKVYYYSNAKGKYVLCKKVKTNTAVIKKLKKNTTYKFKVKAYKNYNSILAEGTNSKVLKIKTKR